MLPIENFKSVEGTDTAATDIIIIMSICALWWHAGPWWWHAGWFSYVIVLITLNTTTWFLFLAVVTTYPTPPLALPTHPHIYASPKCCFLQNIIKSLQSSIRQVKLKEN